MARFKIFDEAGGRINTIIADIAFVEANHPGRFELEPEPPAPPPQAPSGDDVNIERDRRIASGLTFTVAGYGGVPLQGRLQDQINLQARLITAQGYKAAGVTDPVLILRDADNANRILTPDQMIDLMGQGVAWIEATMMVSWAMKDGTTPFEDGIPVDYADDAYWP